MMKYNLYWLMFGFGVFWLIHLIAWASGIEPTPKWIINTMPLFCWGIFSLLEFVDTKYGIFRKKGE